MSFLRTYRGNKFFIEHPERSKFDLEDIAHGLSNMCRFGGHTREFYSVAQHSVLVAQIVAGLPGTSPELELWALMHDSTEAYMIDIPTPLKVTLPGYKTREDALMELLITAFKLPSHGEEGLLPRIVKDADLIALVTEARQLMIGGLKDWPEHYLAVTPFPCTIPQWAPAEAKEAFLEAYKDIQNRIKRRRK